MVVDATVSGERQSLHYCSSLESPRMPLAFDTGADSFSLPGTITSEGVYWLTMSFFGAS